MCASSPECRGYTWRFDGVVGWCYEFAALEDLHECPECHSEAFTEVLEGACLAGDDGFIEEVVLESSDACAQLCYDTDSCHGYTWYAKTTAFPRYCFLYTKCDEMAPCLDCTSGRINCIASPQCYNYKILDEESRNVHFNLNISDFPFSDNYAVSRFRSPRWEDDGYYRVIKPAGIKITTSDPGPQRCGTDKPFWINGETESLEVGEETAMEVCVNYGNDPCFVSEEITATRCPGDYLVYYLPHTPGRYCTSM